MFSDRVRYIVNVLIHLGFKGSEEYETASDIAEDVDVPDSYLNKIIGELANLGYLDTKKGPNGGVRLRHDPDEIFMTQLLNDIDALEHNSLGDACCVPRYLDTCIMEEWINGFKTDVIGKSTLQDIIRTVQ